MIINNARGSHSSPGVYTKEVDITYSVKSLGITSLALAGETLRGAAFEPVKIEKWSEFEDYFGPTSAEKFRGTGYPKYELPYIAKEYLKESKQLYVCRVLGLSGYGSYGDTSGGSETFKAYVIYALAGNVQYPVAVLRSTGSYTGEFSENICEPGGDVLEFAVTNVTLSAYTSVAYDANCSAVGTAVTEGNANIVTADNLGRFTLNVTYKSGDSTATTSYPVSLNYGDSDYIYNVFSTKPYGNNAPLFVEYVYDYALSKLYKTTPSSTTITIAGVTEDSTHWNYKEAYKCAVTPWIVSQVNAAQAENGAGAGIATAQRLFRAYTISDGDNANNEIKLSIEKIRPDEGTFDLVIRSMNDSDAYPVVLEKFTGCNLIPKDKNYLPLRVGSYDGVYELKSKYIAIEMNEDFDVAGAVPCGFMGYPMHSFSGMTNLPISYNLTYDYALKPKRQYFGFSNIEGIDVDTFTYKGVPQDSNMVESRGFHLDSIVGLTAFANKIKIDGVDKYFDAVDPKTVRSKSTRIPRIVTEAYNRDTIYEDVNARKFTVCFYGGFDGWDIYRSSRTNTDDFKALRYNGETYKEINFDAAGQPIDSQMNYLNLPINANSSDYYAYLAAYRQFANPEAIDINIFATPGIDWINNELLVEDALDVIVDTDEGRGGDALYIVTTPSKPAGASDSIEDMYTEDELVELLANSSIDSSYIATYWPWVKFFDKEENVYINLPVTKDVVRNLAYVDNTSFPWFAPAGINRGDVNCVRACKKTRLADEDTLYDGYINPVKTFASDGVKIWGNKTMYSIDSPLNRVNVRRLMLRIKKLITGAGKNLIFNQYDNSLKDQFLSIVTPILSNVRSNRGLYDYRIDIDDSVEARDAHTLPCTIHVKPTPTLEYIDLTFTIYPESVDFRD